MAVHNGIGIHHAIIIGSPDIDIVGREEGEVDRGVHRITVYGDHQQCKRGSLFSVMQVTALYSCKRCANGAAGTVIARDQSVMLITVLLLTKRNPPCRRACSGIMYTVSANRAHILHTLDSEAAHIHAIISIGVVIVVAVKGSADLNGGGTAHAATGCNLDILLPSAARGNAVTTKTLRTDGTCEVACVAHGITISGDHWDCKH